MKVGGDQRSPAPAVGGRRRLVQLARPARPEPLGDGVEEPFVMDRLSAGQAMLKRLAFEADRELARLPVGNGFDRKGWRLVHR